MNWRAEALCADYDPEIFFPGKGSSKLAKTICSHCPVRLPCFKEGLELEGREDSGVWGGISAHERQRLKKNKR